MGWGERLAPHLAPWSLVDALREELTATRNALDTANFLLAKYRREEFARSQHAAAWIDGDDSHFCTSCPPETERARWQALAIARGNKLDAVRDAIEGEYRFAYEAVDEARRLLG